MYLVTAATHFEMEPFHAACRHDGVHQLVTGIGPVETSVRLMALLNRLSGQIKGVVNFGVGGAYFDSSGSPKAGLLDICLAEGEVLGDFGVCLEEEIERISGKGLEVPDTFVMDEGMFNLASQALQEEQIPFHSGFSYFELNKRGEMWKKMSKSAGLGLHPGGTYPGLELELWAIRG